MHHTIQASIRTGLLLSVFFPFLAANAIMIDGDLKDWIGQPQGNASDWTPLRSTTHYTVEDQDGDANAYLDPGYGGQAYDAEAMYVEIMDGTLYIAVVTGVAPDANADWPAGDIAIDFGNDGIFEYGIVTLGDSDNPKGGTGDAGEVYDVDSWNYGIWTNPDVHNETDESPYKKAHPTTVKTGTLLGSAELKYEEAKYNGSIPTALGDKGGNHYLIEAAIPLSFFAPDLLKQDFTVHWTMTCANDWIQTDPMGVPEPPVSWLLTTALAGLALRKRLKLHPA